MDCTNTIDDNVEMPADDQIISALADHFGVSFGTACDWILEVAESIKQSA